jgi:SAM-dependent methyltransferase
MTVVHTPRYLLRRRLILHLVTRYAAGSFLEIGCGRGELLPWLAGRDFKGIGYEIAHPAAAVARQNVATFEPDLQVVTELDSIRGQKFDYVFAFEVLEHIEDDEEALLDWKDWLKPSGILVVSVPAHRAMWSVADDRGGHFRRYEKAELKSLLERCGYLPQFFWNYGFPLTAVSRHLRSLIYRIARRNQQQEESMLERTMHSSWESTIPLKRATGFASSAMEAAALGLHVLQLAFLNSDLGDGYLVSSQLRE